jgi:hypothetical protein
MDGLHFAFTVTKNSMNVIGSYQVDRLFNTLLSSIHLTQLINLFLSEFKAGKVPILLATDVAARGLGKKSVGISCSFLSE